MDDTMDDIALQGAQKRIDFISRWGFALFAVFIVLAGWLGARYEAEVFGVVFWVGLGSFSADGILLVSLIWLAHRRIKRLEVHKR